MIRLTALAACVLGVLAWLLLLSVDPLSPPTGKRWNGGWE